MEQLRVLVAMASARLLVYLRIIRVDDAMAKAKFNVQDVAAQVKCERKELFSIPAPPKSSKYLIEESEKADVKIF